MSIRDCVYRQALHGEASTANFIPRADVTASVTVPHCSRAENTIRKTSCEHKGARSCRKKPVPDKSAGYGCRRCQSRNLKDVHLTKSHMGLFSLDSNLLMTSIECFFSLLDLFIFFRMTAPRCVLPPFIRIVFISRGKNLYKYIKWKRSCVEGSSPDKSMEGSGSLQSTARVPMSKALTLQMLKWGPVMSVAPARSL